jgi:stage III sporulation protein AE
MLLISITDALLITCMLPLVKICMAFSCVRSVGGSDVGGISKLIRTTFTSVTIFTMSIFMFIFSMKNVISQSADSLTIKTARFAISSFVPIVGASINDALRTVSSSLSLIKSSCGVLAILIIALIMLPIIIYLFLNKISFGILAGISRILKCDKQGEILDEASSICTYILTIVCCTCILFIFAMTIFIKTSSEVI